jgi:uncharacterized protein YeaO (DUF488 family)
MAPPVHLRRIYAAPKPGDGTRVLVDRLWPRGVSRERAAVDTWLRDVAPTTDLRRWYGHRAELAREFRVRYLEELATVAASVEALGTLRELATAGPVTLLTATTSIDASHLPVLRDLIAGAAPG